MLAIPAYGNHNLGNEVQHKKILKRKHNKDMEILITHKTLWV